mmetsp:Transcript_15616/g.59280  ORF Transcript_15616/g.59280 Transcript_15616/m.59280 type:complete len:371 (+) Transcript_15616:4189-5301(+)
MDCSPPRVCTVTGTLTPIPGGTRTISSVSDTCATTFASASPTRTAVRSVAWAPKSDPKIVMLLPPRVGSIMLGTMVATCGRPSTGRALDETPPWPDTSANATTWTTPAAGAAVRFSPVHRSPSICWLELLRWVTARAPHVTSQAPARRPARLMADALVPMLTALTVTSMAASPAKVCASAAAPTGQDRARSESAGLAYEKATDSAGPFVAVSTRTALPAPVPGGDTQWAMNDDSRENDWHCTPPTNTAVKFPKPCPSMRRLVPPPVGPTLGLTAVTRVGGKKAKAVLLVPVWPSIATDTVLDAQGAETLWHVISVSLTYSAGAQSTPPTLTWPSDAPPGPKLVPVIRNVYLRSGLDDAKLGSIAPTVGAA